jgi:hypothetical protein
MIKTGTAALTLALFATLAHADDYLSPTNERVRLSLGFMHVSNTTSIKLDSSAGVPGTPISAENDFGLDKSDFEPKFEAMVRVGQRHRLRFDYFTLDRSGHTTLTGALVFRDVLLQPGDPVVTDVSMRMLGINYEYSFVHREKFEIAASIGINDTDISARARVSTQFRHVDQREDKAGPFPTFGLDSTWVASKRFYFDARAQYFKLAVDHLDGSLSLYELAAFYRLRPNVSFAVGYTGAKATIHSRQTNESGYANFNSKGPEAFVRIAF